ncbi:MAG: bifunctional UDP-3-O-[3-hydroxymyristoyl] N-acetylglucosamine deacetylase/3-hydroxyacyl-ACP dehydratase [Chlorobi bacterium]|nr:bifunctional UDP-3-O-[3-hydroxymyristoyl] N-acetylglucosamine deacetylase/3-hydroxyacyl-ACP dehydratase [Chlorobiota bacterium]
MSKQKTIEKPVSISGVGLHTGQKVNMTLKPAPENNGIIFVRTDLEGHPVIEAKADYVSGTLRGTTLEKNGVQINTVEHVLAAVSGMDLDNIIIELDASEPPIMDGSAMPFVEMIEEAGIKEQEAEREVYVVKENISYIDPDTGSEMILMPSDKFQVTCMVDFGTKVLGTQNAYLKDLSEFKEQIAGARTFSFLHELEVLLKNGLIKGGDLNNAIVFVDKEINDETLELLKKAFKRDDIQVKPNGILNNLALRWPNEAARHKLLDIIGDLTLIGMKIQGKVIASKPGHKINTAFAKKVRKIILNEKRNKVPKIDLNEEPLMGTLEIKQLLPHRHPFLLVDKIYELTDRHVVGVKNVTFNEFFFPGHFPAEPVMPGVLILESMAQTGGVLVLKTVPDPENYLTYFLKMNNVKFKKKVLPGDTLIIRADLLEPIRRGICHMQAYAYANNRLVAEAEMVAQIIHKDKAIEK